MDDSPNKGGTSTGGRGGSGGSMSGAGGNVTGGSAGAGATGGTTGGAGGGSGTGGAGNAGEGGAMGGEGGEPIGGEAGETNGGTAGAGMAGGGMGGAGAGGRAGGGMGGAGAGAGGAGAGGAGAGGAGAGGAGAGGAGAGGAGAGGAGAGGAGAGGAGMSGGGAGGAPAVIPNLYFSEYVEGDTLADAFEVYNATNAPVSLAGCEIRVHYGAAAGSTSASLSGTLAAGDVFVLCLARISTACDVLAPALNDLSGDDSVELACPVGGTMTTLDIIGQYGAGLDPGQQWGGTGMLPGTQNMTLRRRCSSTTGDRNATNAFVPDDNFRGFAVDTVNGLGARTCPCTTPDLTCP